MGYGIGSRTKVFTTFRLLAQHHYQLHPNCYNDLRLPLVSISMLASQMSCSPLGSVFNLDADQSDKLHTTGFQRRIQIMSNKLDLKLTNLDSYHSLKKVLMSRHKSTST